MGNITITSDLITGVDHDNPTLHLIGQNTSDFSQCCGFSDPRSSHQQQRLGAIEKVADHGHRAKHGSSDTTGQTDDFSLAIAYGTDPVEGSLNSGAIIRTEPTQFVHHISQIVSRDRTVP
jgi:hypothetical protein